MKKIMMAMCFVIPSTSLAYENCPVLSAEQKAVIEYSKSRGSLYDLGDTLATIAWQESNAGVNVINAHSQDFGVYQGNYKTLCVQSGIQPGTFKCNQEVQKVVFNIEVAADHAIETLTWWRDYYRSREHKKNVYELMVRSYNAGFSPSSKDADIYWEKFKKNYKLVKECF